MPYILTAPTPDPGTSVYKIVKDFILNVDMYTGSSLPTSGVIWPCGVFSGVATVSGSSSAETPLWLKRRT